MLAQLQIIIMGILNIKKYLPSEIIVDGKIIYHNLKEFNLDENWLNNQLKQQNISSVNNIFYAEIQGDGTLFIEKISVLKYKSIKVRKSIIALFAIT